MPSYWGAHRWDTPVAAPTSSIAKPSDTLPRPRPRIESLSDMVFGLALSVGALALVATPPTSSEQLYSDIVTFGFSFLILIMVWFSYTRIMSEMTFEDHRTLTLNTVLLFTVSVEPFLFNLLHSANHLNGFFNAASQAYAVDLGLMMVILGLFAWGLSVSTQPPLALSVRTGFRAEAINRWVAAGIFFVTVAPVFDQVSVGPEPLRIWLWLIPLFFFAFARRTRRKAEGP
ncbi:MAG: TMEM175 family protein [Thermoplasmata archaeon]